MPVWGWDASNHDWARGPMDIAAARAAGIDFFVHKCTDGNQYYRDPYFAKAMARARNAGIPVTGAYHVLWNGNVTQQMDWFMSVLDEAAPWWRTEPYLVQFDCEPFVYNGATPTPATIRQAADYLVQRTGGHCRPIVYGPKWVYEDSLTGLPYPLWSSNYGPNTASAYAASYPGDGGSRWVTYSGQTPAILQYSSQARIGSQSQCDANAYQGTLDQLRVLIAPRGDDMSTEAEDTLRALREGTEHAAGAKFAPWLWEVARQKWQAEVSAKLAADEVRDKALSAALDALAKALAVGGGSVDVAAIMQRVDTAAADVKALVEQRHVEELAAYREQYEKTIAGLRAQLAALSQA